MSAFLPHCTRMAGRLALTLAGVTFLVGCQAAGPHAPADVPNANNAALIAHLADQPFVTAEAGYRATYALAHAQAFDGDFAALTDAMEQAGLVCERWDYPAQKRLRRGDVGYLVCRAAAVKTGLNWRLTGLGRYAWRELIYHGIARGGSEMNFMSGGEFVGMLGRAEGYMAKHARRGAAATELSAPGRE
jgi:hypothetical protein